MYDLKKCAVKKDTFKLTCSLCHHFDANRNFCRLLEIDTFPQNIESAPTCKKEGHFVRDMNVQYSYFNFISEDSNIASDYIEDLSKLPKDAKGVPLFVLTKKGIERAIPAYEGLTLLSNHLSGVRREFTFQGQRELIYELGVELARKVCAAVDVELVVLEGEEKEQGFNEFKVPYRIWGI